MKAYATDPANRARLLRRHTLEDALAHDPDDYSIPTDERDASPSREQLETAGELLSRILSIFHPELDDGDLADVQLTVDDDHLTVHLGGERLATIPRATLRIRTDDQ